LIFEKIIQRIIPKFKILSQIFVNFPNLVVKFLKISKSLTKILDIYKNLFFSFQIYLRKKIKIDGNLSGNFHIIIKKFNWTGYSPHPVF